jgi:hypothetical protein
MKKNRSCPKAWLLCLTLLIVLSTAAGCRTPPAPEPTAYPPPVPTTAPPPATTAYPPPAPTTAPLPEPTASPSPEPTQGPVSAEPTLTELRTFPRVTPAEVQQWVAAGEPVFFIDARSVDAWSSATTKVPGALRVPPHEDVAPYLDQIPKDRRVVIYCT